MIKYISADTARTARGLVAQVYDQIKREFGVLGEPLTLHSPAPHVLAGVWSSCRESLLCGTAPRKLKEAVAVAVSHLNRCPYCVDAHTVLLRAASAHDAAWAIQNGREEMLPDSGMRDIVRWAKATRSPGSKELADPPFSRHEAPEIVGTAVWIHYINRMSTIFVGKNLIPLTGNTLGFRSLSERLGGLFFAGVVSKRIVPGESLRLLRAVPPTEEFRWAAASPAIAQAFAAFAAATDEAASISSEARAAVNEKMRAWDGKHPGMGRGWMATSLDSVCPEDRPAARLALLAAFAPDQVDETCVGEFRRRNPTDAALVGAAAWSSFAAARRIASWIYP